MSNHEEEENDRKKAYFIEPQEITVANFECADGWILDIGGGEGIIEKIKGKQVVAIDFRKQELEETEMRHWKSSWMPEIYSFWMTHLIPSVNVK